MDLAAKYRAERAYKKSVQEMMDETMCRPGYRWHGEPLNRCLPAAVPEDYRPEDPKPEEPTPTPEEAIAAESSKRKSKK